MPSRIPTLFIFALILLSSPLLSCSSDATGSSVDGDEPVYQQDGDDDASTEGDGEGSLMDGDDTELPLPDGDSLDDDLPIPDGDGEPANGDDDAMDGDGALDGDVDEDVPEDMSDGDGPATPNDPSEPGPFDITIFTHTLAIPDGLLPTNIQLTIYLPQKTGSMPGILFLHGFQLGPGHYASYATLLASHGYIVILPQLPGSIIIPKTHLALKGYIIAILDWMEDNAGNAQGILQGQLDMSRIGIGGHSMGGKLSMLVASEDDRPKASFNIDPVDAGPPIGNNPVDYPSVTPELMPQIDIPLGLLGETTNSTGLQPCAPAEDNFQQYYIHATSPAIQIETLGANHMSYLDNPDCGLPCSACPAGTANDDTVRKLTQRYMTAFYEVFLMERLEFRRFLNGFQMSQDKADGFILFETKNGF